MMAAPLRKLRTSPSAASTEEISFGEFVRRERLKRGLSQKELAERAKVSYVSVSRIERSETGTVGMKKSLIAGLADGLGLPVEVLKKAIHGENIAWDLVRICQRCWVPGTAPDDRWKGIDAHFCFRCANPISATCNCGEPILLHGKFCPECGVAYGKN